MNEKNKETAVQNEQQQFKSTNEIIDNIIKIFADNVISISDAENILHETCKKLQKQPVMNISEDVKNIYRKRNYGEIK